MNLDLITGAIVKRVLMDESFFPALAIIGCDYSDWPVGPQKALINQYTKLRSEHSHEFAKIKLFDDVMALPEQELADDLAIIKAQYYEAIKRQRAFDLAQRLRMDPLNAEKHIAHFKLPFATTELSHLGLNFDRYIANLDARIREGKNRVTIPGFELVSEMIGGFNPSRVGMLVAQTGFGKTTCAINIAHRAATIMPVVYFNMEMSEQDFAERLICSIESIDLPTLEYFTKHKTDRLKQIEERVLSLPLHFSQGRTMRVQEIFSTAMEYKEKYGLGLLVIDYDQKIALNTSKETPEWKALQLTLEGLDELSKRLDCFILVLAQESSDGDVSGSKRSKFPASCVLRFFEDNKDGFSKTYKIKAIKNRFGRHNQEIEVDYESARYTVREIKPVTDTQPTKKPMAQRVRERMRTPPHSTRADTGVD